MSLKMGQVKSRMMPTRLFLKIIQILMIQIKRFRNLKIEIQKIRKTFNKL
jgi:hypothetical protein